MCVRALFIFASVAPGRRQRGCARLGAGRSRKHCARVRAFILSADRADLLTNENKSVSVRPKTETLLKAIMALVRVRVCCSPCLGLPPVVHILGRNSTRYRLMSVDVGINRLAPRGVHHYTFFPVVLLPAEGGALLSSYVRTMHFQSQQRLRA